MSTDNNNSKVKQNDKKVVNILTALRARHNAKKKRKGKKNFGKKILGLLRGKGYGRKNIRKQNYEVRTRLTNNKRKKHKKPQNPEGGRVYMRRK